MFSSLCWGKVCLMNRTKSWRPENRRRWRALALLAFLIFSFSQQSVQAQFAYRGVRTSTIRAFDGGVATSLSTTATIVDTYTAAMPVLREPLQLQAAGQQTSNLGTFNIVIQAGPTLAANAPAMAAFEQAAQWWESVIADPITVIVKADLASLPAGVLGSAGSAVLAYPYTTIRNAMVADAADEPDDAIVGSLPTAGNYTVTMPVGFGLNGNVFASKANLKALGFPAANLDAVAGTAVDVEITFSSNFAFDFNHNDGITTGQFDFTGIAAHEIGHGLGFFSGVDDVDFFLPGTSNQIEPTPLDMFRYRDGTNDPTTVADFSNGSLAFPRNMVPQHVAIMDQILGGFGGDVEVLMSRGLDFGDGRQASHFKDGLNLGIMDPTAAPGELLQIRPNDLRAFDLIGYEITVVPEASSLMLLAIGGAIALRKRGHSTFS